MEEDTESYKEQGEVKNKEVHATGKNQYRARINRHNTLQDFSKGTECKYSNNESDKELIDGIVDEQNCSNESKEEELVDEIIYEFAVKDKSINKCQKQNCKDKVFVSLMNDVAMQVDATKLQDVHCKITALLSQ